jgi:hypothetical protein
MIANLPEFWERIADQATEEFFRRYDQAMEVVGDRPPWTRKLSARERLELWMQLQMAGPQAWVEFTMNLMQQGVPFNVALKEFVDFNVWGAEQLAKDQIVMEEPYAA